MYVFKKKNTSWAKHCKGFTPEGLLMTFLSIFLCSLCCACSQGGTDLPTSLEKAFAGAFSSLQAAAEEEEQSRYATIHFDNLV